MVRNLRSSACTARLDSTTVAPSAKARRRLPAVPHLLVGLCVWLGLGGAVVCAQTAAPIVLPNTFSTVAGSANGSAGVTGFTAGKACSPGSPYTATDVYGDGCLATQAIFGTDFQDGLRVDGQGNIFIADINNNWTGVATTLVRRVDAKSGIVTLVSSSANSNCALATATTAGAMDSLGDGCAFASAKASKERGWGMDPYGNFFSGSYQNGEVHIYCNAVSPLCPIAAGVTQTYSAAQKQVGNVYRIAGCVQTGTTATGGTTVTAPGSGDGYFASSFWNLPGDVAAWGASSTLFNTTAGITGTAGTCNPTTTGELGSPGGRAVVADQFGNVFISDGTNLRERVIVGPPSYTLPSGTVLTNPLPAVLALYPTYSAVTAAQMYGRIYPMVGGFAASTAGSPCAALAAATSVDAYGDGCPWYNTSQTSANPVGLTLDNTTEGGTLSSNLVLLDGSINGLRVLYMGPTVVAATITPASYPMANAILVNNPGILTVTHGSVYLLAGNSAGVMAAAPTLGTATSVSGFARLAAGPNGNLYLARSSTTTAGPSVGFYDLSTGYVRLLVQSSFSAAGTTTVVPATAAITTYTCATPGTGDSQAAFATTGAYSSAALTTNACFNNNGTGSSQLTVSADASNNLYIGDTEIDTAGYGRSRIREVLASQLFPTTLGTPITASLLLHGPAGTAAGATAIAATALNVSAAEINLTTPTCATAANADQTVDCLATITFAPQAPGLRTASLALSEGAASSNFQLFGMATGSALVTDPASPTAPITTSLASKSAVPAGVAVDAAGDVFTIDTAAGKFIEISGGTTTQLPGTLPANPTQLSLDLQGNLYAAGVGNASLTKLTLKGTAYTAGTISIAGIAAPQAAVVDQLGNLYVADKTTASVYKIAAATISGATLPGTNGTFPNDTPIVAVATGLSNPIGLAFDTFGTLYIADSGVGSILRVDAKSGATTTLLTGIHPVAISTDAAGDIYYQDSVALTLVEIPFASISNGVASTTTVNVIGSLSKPSGLAVAGNGNVYTADTGSGTLKLIARSVFAFNFGVGSAGSPTLTGTLTNAGNQAATASAATGNSTNLVLSGSGSNPCTFTAGALGPDPIGSACGFSASFVGLGSAPVTSVTTLLPAASTIGSLTLSGTLTAVSGTTTNLAPVSATALPGASINLTATVASTAAVAGQTVNFLNGTAILGTATTNSAGVATYTLTAGALGTVYSLTASFPGSPTLGASTSARQTVTVALTPTAITLALSTNSTYPTQPVTLTATQTPAAVGQTITFLSGTTVLGTGTIGANGVATYIFTPTTGGTYSIMASFAADGKVYAAAVSAPQILTISASAVLFNASPATLNIAAGSSGQVTLALTPAGGFNGQVTLGCKSPVAYVSCALSFSTVSLTTIQSTVATITVAPTTSAISARSNGIFAAMLAPFGLLALSLGLRKRTRGLARLMLVVCVLAGSGLLAAGAMGCSTSNASLSGPAPTGTQAVTFTATAAGSTLSSTVTVTIQ